MGPQEALQVAGLAVSNVVCHRQADEGDDVLVQYRSSGEAMPATVSSWAKGLRVCFAQPAVGVAPGQVAVAYRGQDVLWSGIIDQTWAPTAEGP